MGIEHLLDYDDVQVEENTETGEVDEQPIQETSEQEQEILGDSGEGSQEGDQERIEQEILGEEGELEEGSEEEGGEEGHPQEGRYKVKVNGQELEVGIDDLLKNYALGASSNERFQEASRLKEESRTLVNALKNNTVQTLADLGVDFKQIANQLVAEQVDYELMDENAKRAHDFKKQLDALQKKEDERLALEERQQKEAAIQEAKQRALSQIEEAMNANPQLPKNNWTISKMASYMAQFKEAGHEPPMDKVAAKVKADYEEQNRLFIQNMSPEDMESFLGRDTVRKIAKRQGKQLNTNTYRNGTTSRSSESPTKDPSKGMTKAEWRQMLANMS